MLLHQLHYTTKKEDNCLKGRSHVSCLESQPAHFMLPTHAIRWRSRRSVEMCPRARKATPDPSSRQAFYID